MPSRRASVEALLDDLVAEHEDLDRVLSDAHESSWDIPTPAPGWSVRDQVSHLAFFDDAATTALTEPETFAAMARAALERGGDPMAEHLRRGRAMDPAALLAWWRGARGAMVGAARATRPDTRIPWFGPAMSLMSFVSARLMETWAHGQDVADALGVVRVPTDRLRHVAYLGVRARRFSYLVRGLEPPPGSVHVELQAPSGEQWTWDADGGGGEGGGGGERGGGDHGAGRGEPGEAPAGAVRGSALDFCLVVTQRRHLLDTGLEASGQLATGWLEVAQAFAGPPGPGRAPGAAGSNRAR